MTSLTMAVMAVTLAGLTSLLSAWKIFREVSAVALKNSRGDSGFGYATFNLGGEGRGDQPLESLRQQFNRNSRRNSPYASRQHGESDENSSEENSSDDDDDPPRRLPGFEQDINEIRNFAINQNYNRHNGSDRDFTPELSGALPGDSLDPYTTGLFSANFEILETLGDNSFSRRHELEPMYLRGRSNLGDSYLEPLAIQAELLREKLARVGLFSAGSRGGQAVLPGSSILQDLTSRLTPEQQQHILQLQQRLFGGQQLPGQLFSSNFSSPLESLSPIEYVLPFGSLRPLDSFPSLDSLPFQGSFPSLGSLPTQGPISPLDSHSP